MKVLGDFSGVLQTALGTFVVVLGGDANSQNGDIQGLITRCYLALEGGGLTDADTLWCRGGTWVDWEVHSHR